MLNKVCFLSLFARVCCLLVRYTPVLEVSQGKLRGLQSFNGQNQYFGIPYAASKRFQLPKDPEKWNNIFDATYPFDTCAHTFVVLQLGKEDCLKLDIYTPGNAIRGHNLPILVFFHGGSYSLGAKWQYNPEFLVKKNVIVVIVNYRLGVLGFLCLNNVANIGLKDQVAALKWIQKNIAAFGGDPDNVTISGQSAGAATASMHFLSKMSKGLFHKAILMSGITLTPWSFNVEPLTGAFEDASKIKPVSNENDVYNTFLNLPIKDLLKITYGKPNDIRSLKYSPCGDYNLTDPFFHDTPYNIIKSGDFNKVPMIIGFTNLEGLLFYRLYSETDLIYLEDHLVESLPVIFNWCSDEDKRRIANKLHLHYFGNKKIYDIASMKGIINMAADFVAYTSINAFSKLMANYSNKPVYNYMFSYEGGRNFVKFISDSDYGLKGATHVDDLFYITQPGAITIPLNDADNLVVEKYTTMLTDFMKYGDPTPSKTSLIPVRWPPTTANRSQVMMIDEPLSVIDTPAHVRGEFFLSVLCEHGLSGYVPCDSAMQCNLDK